MPTQDLPYFMENEEWYTFNEEEWKYELTDKAPQEAIDSYNDFYKEKIVVDKEGNEYKTNPDIDDDDEEENAMNLFGLQGGNQNGMQQ